MDFFLKTSPNLGYFLNVKKDPASSKINQPPTDNFAKFLSLDLTVAFTFWLAHDVHSNR